MVGSGGVFRVLSENGILLVGRKLGGLRCERREEQVYFAPDELGSRILGMVTHGTRASNLVIIVCH